MPRPIVVVERSNGHTDTYLLHPGIGLDRAVRDFSRWHTLRVAGRSEWPTTDNPGPALD